MANNPHRFQLYCVRYSHFFSQGRLFDGHRRLLHGCSFSFPTWYGRRTSARHLHISRNAFHRRTWRIRFFFSCTQRRNGWLVMPYCWGKVECGSEFSFRISSCAIAKNDESPVLDQTICLFHGVWFEWCERCKINEFTLRNVTYATVALNGTRCVGVKALYVLPFFYEMLQMLKMFYFSLAAPQGMWNPQ